MRYLILTDIHGNCDALDSVLQRVRRKRFDAVLFLGDLVGYGAGPNQVIETLRNLPGKNYMVRGNHDKVVAGLDDGDNFNPAAREAYLWTRGRLTSENIRYVRQLPQGPLDVPGGVFICHGSPLDEDAYVFSDFDAFEIFSSCPAPIVFMGHTHIPSYFVLHDGGIDVSLLRGRSGTIKIQPEMRYIVNPGSVGQPRDRDPRAAYMTYDTEKKLVRWYRVEYPVEKAQDRILRANLPRVLADRLAFGV